MGHYAKSGNGYCTPDIIWGAHSRVKMFQQKSQSHSEEKPEGCCEREVPRKVRRGRAKGHFCRLRDLNIQDWAIVRDTRLIQPFEDVVIDSSIGIQLSLQEGIFHPKLLEIQGCLLLPLRFGLQRRFPSA